MKNEHIDDLVDLAALDALDPEESVAVRQHVRGCAACRTLLQQAEAAAAGLGKSVELRRAPDSLRGRVLTRVLAEAAPQVAESASVTITPLPPPNTKRRSRGRMRLLQLGALAAGLALPIAGFALWAAQLQSEVDQLKATNRDMAATQNDIIVLATSPEIKTTLHPTDHAPHALGWATWNTQDNSCTVKVKQLPPPQEGEVYSVRYDSPNGTVTAGEIRPDSYGGGSLVFDVSRWRSPSYQITVVSQSEGRPEMPLLKGELRRE